MVHPRSGRRNLVKVIFDLEQRGRTETLWAERIGEDRCRLQNTPFYAYSVSLGDVVEVEACEAIYKFKNVIIRSGHSSYRLWVEEEITSRRFQEHWRLIEQLGCSFEQASKNLVAVDVPSQANIHEVYRRLEEGEHARVWEFEEGHCGHVVKE